LALAAASVVGTVLAALRHLPARWWRLPVVAKSDVPTAARFFGHGLCSGFFVALFMVLEPARSGANNWPAAAAYPLILSLGVMEWQLRSLRAGARRALLGSCTLSDFARKARKKLARSTLSYLGALAVLTALVQVLAYARGVPVPVPLLVAGATLAVAFFLGLVVVACGRVEVVLRGWLAGLAVYGAWGLVAWASGSGWGRADASLAFCTATSVSVVVLAVAACRVVVDPICHG
jgi:hypothetical protein